MAPPRLKCLNISRHILRQGAGTKAMSTSQVRRADEPSRTFSPANLLAALGDDVSSQRPPPRDPFNSITLPRNNARTTLPRTVPVPTPATSTANHAIQRLIERADRKQAARLQATRDREPGQLSTSSADELAKHKLGQDLSRQITRRWKEGDAYAPHDLSWVEMAKWKNRGRPTHDVFDVLDFKPVENYKNFSVMSEYMTPMGRIKHSKETGLRPVNQRRIARAIRRSIGMGMMPSVHRHPEILQKVAVRNEQMSPLNKGPM